MPTENLISAIEFCRCHSIEISFIRSLNDYGLIEANTEENELFIHEDDLNKVEKMVHLHYELNINLEGMEAIYYMLERVELMQEEVRALRNRLKFYE